MKVDILVTNIREMVTLRGENAPRYGEQMAELGIVEDGFIAVKDGLVYEVGKMANLSNQYTSEQIIDARAKVVTPGFVDPHTHPVFLHTRENEFELRLQGKSYVEISKAGGGINSTIQSSRDADEEELYNKAHIRIKKMITQGTTTLEAKSGYGLTTAGELKQLSVIDKLRRNLPVDIIPTFMGAHEYPVEYKSNHHAYLDILCNEMIPAVVEQNIAKFCDIFTEAHVYSVQESRKVLSCAKEYGLKLKMHADEIEPIGGAELAAELGCVSADHLGAASDEGLKALKVAKVIPVLLPATLFSLGSSRYARAREMINLGLPVALASDYNPGSCNCDSMPFVMTQACLKMKMTPAEALVAATINAACAINMEEEVGSLQMGKKADFIIWDIPSYKFIPYHFGSSYINSVYKNGILIHQNQD